MTNSTPTKILLLGEIEFANDIWNEFTKTHTIITPKSTNRADFLAECRSGAFDGVLACYRTFPSISTTGRIDAELCAALPSSLRFLAHCGAGYDPIDAAACADRNPPLLVSNVPDPVNDATADTAMFLMLGALRFFNASMASLRRGEWRDGGSGSAAPPPMGHDPQGKTLGVLGMGGIGRNLKRKAEGFGMTVIYHNRNRLSEGLAEGAEYVGFEELLKKSDVLSLNLPLNEHTRHTISTKELRMMKKSAVLINTARGAVVDEAALVTALDEGVIAGAGLDVFEEEPKIHEGLLRNDKVMLLPHVGTYTWETMYKMEAWAIENVRMAIEESRLKSPIPEHKNLKA